jgi:hypothetical protein
MDNPAHLDASDRGPGVVVACWAAKGGSGTSVFAAALALSYARLSRHGAVLVDLAGDMPAVLGVPTPDKPGIVEWFQAPDTVSYGGLETQVAPGLWLAHRGTGSLDATTGGRLASSLADLAVPVVVDCGTAPRVGAAELADRADHSVLVTRQCCLAIQRAVATDRPRSSGVVVVTEPGRFLSPNDISDALAAPVLTEVPYDPAVARQVDAGLLLVRTPASLAASVAKADSLHAWTVQDKLDAATQQSPAPPGPDLGVAAW